MNIPRVNSGAHWYNLSPPFSTIALEGHWVWLVKDWIDRRWMRDYVDLPEMGENDGFPAARGLADPEAKE